MEFYRLINDKCLYQIQKKFEPKRYHPLLNAVFLLNESEILEASFFQNLQEYSRIKNNLRCQEIAKLLVNDSGKLETENLSNLIKILATYRGSLGVNSEEESIFKEHLLSSLLLLAKEESYEKQLMKIHRPTGNHLAEHLILESLGLSFETKVEDKHARMATLAAWLFPIRQNVGSCFATAPAIQIQESQPLLLLKDLEELISKGYITRIVQGKEYTVPVSTSSGIGDLKKPFYYHIHYVPLSSYPGFIKAFEYARYFSKDIPFIEKKRKTERILNSLQTPKLLSGKILTPEEILKELFLEIHQVSNEKVRQFELSQKEINTTAVLAHPSHIPLTKRHENVQKFLKELKQAEQGFKSLTDNALIKSWEFSLASFSETKGDFSRWNLYVSLGFDKQEKCGVGECLQTFITNKIEDFNRLIQEYQEKYEQTYVQVKYLSSKLKSAQTEKDISWARMEYETHVHEMDNYLELRDTTYIKGKNFSELFVIMLKKFDEFFPIYFQEVYDANMRDVRPTSIYDDAPAGFRLLYKHGRANPGTWTLIYNPEEFVKSLVDFFIAMENEIGLSKELEPYKDEYRELTTNLIQLVKSHEFLEQAIYRISKRDKQPIIKHPLQHLDKIQNKPWSYISGGTMGNLIQCYYRLEDSPKEKSRWIESPMELFIFLADLMKEMSPNQLKAFNKSHNSLLMFSPTHAFRFLPFEFPFSQTWKNNTYTYTYIRDNLVNPRKRFVQQIIVDQEIAESFFHFMKRVNPELTRLSINAFPKIFRKMTLKEFKITVLDSEIAINLDKELSKGVFESLFDSSVYRFFPAFRKNRFKEHISLIAREIENLKERELLVSNVEKMFHKYSGINVLGSEEFYNLINFCLIQILKNSYPKFNFSKALVRCLQKNGLAMPEPIIFADTNWVGNYFAFVVNPFELDLELWRVSYWGLTGTPMKTWKKWITGKNKNPWGVFVEFREFL